MDRNEDVLAYAPGFDCDWVFVTPLSGSSLDEQHLEFLRIVESVLNAGRGFIRPVGVTYAVTWYDDPSIKSIFDADPIDVTRKTIETDSVLSIGEITEHIDALEPQAESQVISVIEIDQTEVKITLRDGDHYISRETPARYKRWHLGQILDKAPTWNPIEITIQQGSAEDETCPAVCEIIIRTKTDIWFENTDLGIENRQRLGRFLRTIKRQLPIVDGWFDSNKYWIDDYPELNIFDERWR